MIYFESENLNILIDACSFTSNHAIGVKIYSLALGMKGKGAVLTHPDPIYVPYIAPFLSALSPHRLARKSYGPEQPKDKPARPFFTSSVLRRPKKIKWPFFQIFFCQRSVFMKICSVFSKFRTQE